VTSFKHFVLTRFNVAGVKGLERGLDLPWLEHRFDLFDQFCFPSVRGQVCQNFTWIVLCDSRTPATFRQRLEALSRWPNFVPVFADDVRHDFVNRVIASRLPATTRFLITTRLDNDDAISTDLVRIVQEQFREQELEFINFVDGYCWHRGRLYAQTHLSNQFLSLIEPVDQFKTVWTVEHLLARQHGSVMQIFGKPAWLQVVHGQNVANRVGGSRLPMRELLDGGRFSLALRSLPPTENAIAVGLDRAFGWTIFLERLRHGLGFDTGAPSRAEDMIP
jgi:hypothetical protein